MTNIEYIQSGPDSHRADSEELAALIIRYRNTIPGFMLRSDAARMVELAERLQAVTVANVTFTAGLFADHGDGVHVKWDKADAETP